MGRVPSGPPSVALLRQHDAFVPTDNPWQRRARLLAAMWRTDLGESAGPWPGKDDGTPLGSRLRLPRARERGTNFLTATVRDQVERAIGQDRQHGALYAKNRLFGDLLSSQPLAFNAFGELAADLDLATMVWREVFGPQHMDRVTKICFEWSPGRGNARFTGTSSAFDVLVVYRTRSGVLGFSGIEVKYHEDLAGKSYEADRNERIGELTARHQPGADIAELSKAPLWQLWLDHLLALSMLGQQDPDTGEPWRVGEFLVLAPGGNTACRSAVERYNTAIDTAAVRLLTLEDFVDLVSRHTEAGWVGQLARRYLDLDPAAVARHGRIPDPAVEQERLANAGREYFAQFMLASLAIGERPPGWNKPASVSPTGWELLRRLDPWELATSPPEFYWEFRLPPRHGQERSGWPDLAAVWPDRLLLIELKTEPGSVREGQVDWYFQLALTGWPGLRVDLLYVTRDRVPDAPRGLPDRAHYATTTWDSVRDRISQAYGRHRSGLAGYPDGKSVGWFLEWLRAELGQSKPVSSPATSGPSPSTSTVGLTKAGQPALDVQPRADLAATLAVAGLVEADRKQRALDLEVASRGDAEPLRDTIVDELGRRAAADEPCAVHVRPWVWTSASGGRALTPGGERHGVEVRLSYYR
jgi:hypothetical protein